MLGKFYQKTIGIINPTQSNPEKIKKEEAELHNFRDEKEIEVLLQECEALRAEAVLHLEAQYQLTNVALVLLGGLATAATLLFGLNGQGLHLTTLNLYFLLLYLVLIASALFSSLFHTFLSHQHDLGLIGAYIYHVTRVRLRELLEKKEKEDSQFFSWDYFHQQRLTSGDKLSWLVSLALTSAHGVVEVALAVLMLAIAFVIYWVNYSLLVASAWSWVAVGIFIFDILYLLISMPVVAETVSIFKQINQDASLDLFTPRPYSQRMTTKR